MEWQARTNGAHDLVHGRHERAREALRKPTCLGDSPESILGWMVLALGRTAPSWTPRFTGHVAIQAHEQPHRQSGGRDGAHTASTPPPNGSHHAPMRVLTHIERLDDYCGAFSSARGVRMRRLS